MSDETLRLVPVEPTREMWAAAGTAACNTAHQHHDKIVEAVWSAMLSAAPTPSTRNEPIGRVVQGFSSELGPTRFVQWVDGAPDVGTPLYAAPPPPQADALRTVVSDVRDWLALLAIADVQDVMQGATAMFDLCDAALKSTAAQEGGE